MVRLILLCVLTLCAFGEQVEVRAAHFYADEKKGENVLSGGVFVKRDKDILRTNKLIITTDKNRKAKFYRALGDARFEIMLKNKLYKGRGDELSYDVANEIYEIKGNAVVEEAQSNQKLVGETIIIDKKQESYTVMSVEQKPVKFTFELDKK